MVNLLFAGGGLGNQMFQYAYARYIQYKFGDALQFNLYGFQADKRKYALENFMISENIVFRKKSIEKLDIIIFKIKRKLILNKLRAKKSSASDMYYDLSNEGIFYTPDSYSFYPSNDNCRAKVKYICGLFQSEKFFFPIGDIIKNELQVKPPVMQKNIDIIDRIKSTNSICVHIRRGDYLEKPWCDMLNICDENYYLNAMEQMVSKNDDPVFYVFSNTSEDLKWISENYKFKHPVIYVDNKNPDYEELRLMYSCKHFILSNSSFSWWAQYLSRNDDKIVIAPNKWIIGEICDDVFMDEWILIET